MTNIYLDVCCLNRPYDDQTQDRVRMEAEAVKTIMFRIGRGIWAGIRSEVTDFEIGKMEDLDRHLNIVSMLDAMSVRIVMDEADRTRANELQKLGFKAVDASHIASAEHARADIFLTTDDDLLKNATRHKEELRVRVANPLSWLREELDT